MRILALDQSETSCGWAVWGPDDARVTSGAWTLGSALTPPGIVFGKLHERMTDLHRVGKIDAIFYERPRHFDGWNAQSNTKSHLLLVGLVAHILSWGEAMGCRVIRDAHMSTWRAHFLRGMTRPTDPNGGKIDGILKVMAVKRCKELGFRTSSHDQAEAIGILDYACSALGIKTPWALQHFAGRPVREGCL